MSHNTEELIKAAGVARKEHRLDDALRNLEEAVRLSRQAGERRNLILALKGLAQILRDLGKSDGAGQLYQAAAELSREEGDPDLLAHTIRHLGDIHREAKRWAEAEVCYNEALALYRANEPAPLDLANAIRPLAILKEETGKAEEAKPLWQEAKELYAAVKVQIAVAECTKRLARLN